MNFLSSSVSLNTYRTNRSRFTLQPAPQKNTRQVKSPPPPLLFLMQLYNDIMSWFFPFLSVCIFFWRSWSYLSPASSASIKQTCSFEKLTSRWWRGSTRECAPYYVLHLILLSLAKEIYRRTRRCWLLSLCCLRGYIQHVCITFETLV
jgi:hypothetical protein